MVDRIFQFSCPKVCDGCGKSSEEVEIDPGTRLCQECEDRINEQVNVDVLPPYAE